MSLDKKIESATFWTLALGSLGVVASVLQMFGVVEAGVPGWFNLLIATSSVVLGLSLSRRSLALTGLLLAIFVAILADTLVATGIVLEERGVGLMLVLVLRYMVFLAAARAVGQVLAGIVAERREAANRGSLDADASSADAPPVVLGPGKSPSAIYFVGLAVLLLIGAAIYAAVIPLEDAGAMIFGGMIVFAGIVGFAAFAESRYVPNLVRNLQEAAAAGDAARASGIRDRLVQMKGRGARALAVAAIEFDSGGSDEAKRSGFACEMLRAIAAIGTVDRDAALAIRARFLSTRSGPGVKDVRDAAHAALAAAGYAVAEPAARET